jgi:DnaJ domain
MKQPYKRILLVGIFLSSSESFMMIPNSSGHRISSFQLMVASIGDPGQQLERVPERKKNTMRSSSRSKRTLYDILGASPQDTKAELKQKYVALAKQTHPDAVRAAGRSCSINGKMSSSRPDFTEIAAAWSVLSDEKERQRYDRQLQGAVLVQVIAVWAEACLGTTMTAVEIAMLVLATVLIPLIPAVISVVAELLLLGAEVVGPAADGPQQKSKLEIVP